MGPVNSPLLTLPGWIPKAAARWEAECAVMQDKGFISSLFNHGSNSSRRALNVKLFRGGLVSKARRLVYHSTLGLRVKKEEEKKK